MKERPILFSGPMVREILNDTKTQTRRIAKRLRGLLPADWEPCSAEEWPLPSGPRLPGLGYQVFRTHDETGYVAMECPYGAPGDRLWVRETWQAHPRFAGAKPSDIEPGPVAYRATHEGPPGSWRPAIFMPRWASRLSLEITDVRVERLQEITEDDARAEGIRSTRLPLATARGTTVWHAEDWPTPLCADTARGAFAALWDSINGKRFPWESNPWVWVITFERCS